MIIKYSKIISCTSQHPSFPAKNLLEYRSNIDLSKWLCAQPGIRESEVIFELAEPAPITGVDIGNSRCCTVRISGAQNSDLDHWVTIIEHQFMSRNDAEDGRFKDQVQLFTKKEIGEEITRTVFARVKVTCIQPANLKVLFGLSFLILRTEDKADAGNLDAFGRFKVKQNEDDTLDKFKEKYLQHIRPRSGNFKTELAKQIGEKRALDKEERGEEVIARKRPSLNLTGPSEEPETSNEGTKREGEKIVEGESNPRPVKRSRLSVADTKDTSSGSRTSFSAISGSQNPPQSKATSSGGLKKPEKVNEQSFSNDTASRGRARCSLCLGNEENVLCKTCNLLKPERETMESVKKEKPSKKGVKTVKKPTQVFGALFQGIVFSLSGYKNPERDDIRRKAIAMGAKYLADTNTRNNNCTHLICAFKNTPKYNQLKGKAKIVSHTWVEKCYEKKTRFPWRRYALDNDAKNEPESEDEIVSGPVQPPSIYDQDTDSDY